MRYATLQNARALLTLLCFVTFQPFLSSKETIPSHSESSFYQEQRKAMVEKHLVQKGITDQNVLNAMHTVKRHLFVDNGTLDSAYENNPLPIACRQTISQPFIVAYMLQEARLHKNAYVLEIGTGSGYNAALLSLLCTKVYTIEIHTQLGIAAEEKLKKLGYTNIDVIHDNGHKGFASAAPFDAIIATCAAKHVPQIWVDQLKEDGILLMPLEESDGLQWLVRITKNKNTPQGFDQEKLLPVRFVPLLDGV